MKLRFKCSHLTFCDVEEAFHHVIHVVVLQVGIVLDGWVVAGLVPAEALGGVVPIGKDPCQGAEDRGCQNSFGLPSGRLFR